MSTDSELGVACAELVERLPVHGAAISTIGGLDEPQTLIASDRLADRLDEAQLDTGEGPCWDAIRLRDWVESPDLAVGESRWPGFRDAIREQPLGAVFAFPLRLGTVQVGTLDLYRRDPGGLPAPGKTDARDLLDHAARVVLRATLARLGADPERDETDVVPRAVIHQATGMVLAQLDVTPDDALLLLRARAFSSGLTLREVAREVVDRRLDFSREPETGEPADD